MFLQVGQPDRLQYVAWACGGLIGRAESEADAVTISFDRH